MNYSSKKLLFKKICECLGVCAHHVAYIKFTLEISQEEIHQIWMKKMSMEKTNSGFEHEPIAKISRTINRTPRY